MSRRKQEKPQPRKNVIKGDADFVQDILTCGVCQKDFPLADIVRFIQHKVHSCNKENCVGLFEESEDSQDLEPDAPAVTAPKEEDIVSSSSLNGKTLAKDTSVNTDCLSEPRSYVCSTCKQSLTSAWALIVHVQHLHGLNIYLDSSLSSDEKRQKSGDGHTESSSLPTINGSYSLRAPLLERQLDPTTPLFPRASSQELRLDLLGLSSNNISNGATTPPPLLEAPQMDCRPRCDSMLQDFYSQRLRVLAGATSPNATISPRNLLQPSFKAILNSNHKTSPPPTNHVQASSSPPDKAQSSSASSTTSDHHAPSVKSRLCEYCGKSFQFKSNLIVHRRSHTGEKPFKCHICQHACTQASKLKRHMKTHKSGKKRLDFSNANSSADDPESDQSPTKTADEESKVKNTEKQTNGDSEYLSEEQDDDQEDDDEEIDIEDEEGDDEEELNVDGMEEESKENEEGKLVIDDDEEDDAMVAEDLTKKPMKNGPTENGDIKVEERLSKRIDRKPMKHSLLSEVMEKIGLANIQQYNEAYKQALKESSARNSIKQERYSSGTDGSASNDAGSRYNYDSHHPERPPREGTRSAGQSPLSFGGGLLGTFDQSSSLKRLRLEDQWKDKDREGNGLYAGLWVPAVTTHSLSSYRDLYHHNNNNGDHPHKLSIESALNSDNGGSPRPGPSGGLANSLLNKSKEQRRNDTCEYCGKVFKNCSNLTVHRRSHTGEKPYKCELCSYACAQSSKLTRHMKTHGRLGKDVYRCRFCDMPFSVPSTLEKHMRKCVVSQSGGSPYLMSERDSDSKEMAT